MAVTEFAFNVVTHKVRAAKVIMRSREASMAVMPALG